ncbi:unnamed protein product, partial [Trypanosoma congolense IL3000]
MARWDNQVLETPFTYSTLGTRGSCEYPFQPSTAPSTYAPNPAGAPHQLQSSMVQLLVSDPRRNGATVLNSISPGVQISGQNLSRGGHVMFQGHVPQGDVRTHIMHHTDPHARSCHSTNNIPLPHQIPVTFGAQYDPAGPMHSFADDPSRIMWQTTMMYTPQPWAPMDGPSRAALRHQPPWIVVEQEPLAAAHRCLVVDAERQLASRQRMCSRWWSQHPRDVNHLQHQPNHRSHAYQQHTGRTGPFNAPARQFSRRNHFAFNRWKQNGVPVDGQFNFSSLLAPEAATRPPTPSPGNRLRHVRSWRGDNVGSQRELRLHNMYTFEAAMNLDVDNMSYEQLLELAERVGRVERGVDPDRLKELCVRVTPENAERGSANPSLIDVGSALPTTNGERERHVSCQADAKMEDSLMCCICLDDLNVGHLATRMPCCGNFFHCTVRGSV